MGRANAYGAEERPEESGWNGRRPWAESRRLSARGRARRSRRLQPQGLGPGPLVRPRAANPPNPAAEVALLHALQFRSSEWDHKRSGRSLARVSESPLSAAPPPHEGGHVESCPSLNQSLFYVLS